MDIMEFINLSDVFIVLRMSTTLDLSDPQDEKSFVDWMKYELITEHKKGNLSFYSNKGECINFAIVKVSEGTGSDELNIAISDDEKDLVVGEIYVFPCVMLDAFQIINLVEEKHSLAKKALIGWNKL